MGEQEQQLQVQEQEQLPLQEEQELLHQEQEQGKQHQEQEQERAPLQEEQGKPLQQQELEKLHQAQWFPWNLHHHPQWFLQQIQAENSSERDPEDLFFNYEFIIGFNWMNIFEIQLALWRP